MMNGESHQFNQMFFSIFVVLVLIISSTHGKDVYIGSELGTTSSVAVYIDGQVQILTLWPIPEWANRWFSRTLIWFSEIHQIQSLRSVKCFRPSFHYQWIQFDLNEVPIQRNELFSHPGIVGLILRTMKQLAELFLGQNMTRAVVAISSSLSQEQRQVIHRAQFQGGSEVRRGRALCWRQSGSPLKMRPKCMLCGRVFRWRCRPTRSCRHRQPCCCLTQTHTHDIPRPRLWFSISTELIHDLVWVCQSADFANKIKQPVFGVACSKIWTPG